MPTALMKFTGCPKESIGLPGKSLATCTCHEKPFGSTCSHRCRFPLAVNEQARSILSSRLSLACLSKIQAPVPWSSCKGYVRFGYDGGITILRAYVSELRSPLHPPRAFVRMEPGPAERFEVDWGHFGALDYAGDKRKLYAFCLVDGHSRMLYVEFTHSQSFETFVRCHLHAFQALGGVARECWYDNLLTVVAEHVGTLVRFNPRFLGFARECGFFPRACNPAAGWEKGKVERGGVGYLRQNFWPLRQFTDLSDVNRQAREWLDEVANQRLHRETRQRPCERFRPDCLRPLPPLTPDYRDTAEALVYKDLRLQFDGNRYCAPPHLVGQHLTVKADASSVALYHRNQEIVRYPRCWRRGQTLGAERFE